MGFEEFETKKRLAKYHVIDTLNHFCVPFEPLMINIVGSAYIHDKETSDIDVLVLIKTGEEHCGGIETMTFPGWQFGGSAGEGDDSMWGSWKKTIDGIEVNMLLTNSQEFFTDWMISAEVCRYLHRRGILKDDRTDRVAIHKIIMEGCASDELFPMKQELPIVLSFY